MDDPMFRTVSNLTLLVLLISGSSGCSLMEKTKTAPHEIQKSVQSLMNRKEKSEFEEPVRMAAIWSDGVFDQVGSPRIRGFGARLFFYNEKGEPIKVDGELVVYGYDDAVAKEDYSPNRKFVFERSKFQAHFSKSELGNSYSVWVPWEKVGTGRKSVSLIPVFVTANGTMVKGGQTVNVLPGPEPKLHDDSNADASSKTSSPGQTKNRTPTVKTAEYSSDTNNSDVQTAAYNEPSKPNLTEDSQSSTPKRDSQATTILLPRTMSRRLNSLPPQSSFERNPKKNKQESVEGPASHGSADKQAETSTQSPLDNSSTNKKPVVFGKPG